MNEFWYRSRKPISFTVPKKITCFEISLIEKSDGNRNSIFPKDYKKTQESFYIQVTPEKKYSIESVLKLVDKTSIIWSIKIGNYHKKIEFDEDYLICDKWDDFQNSLPIPMPLSISMKENVVNSSDFPSADTLYEQTDEIINIGNLMPYEYEYYPWEDNDISPYDNDPGEYLGWDSDNEEPIYSNRYPQEYIEKPEKEIIDPHYFKDIFPITDSVLLYLGNPILLSIPDNTHYMNIEVMKFSSHDWEHSILERCNEDSFPRSFDVRVSPRKNSIFFARINPKRGCIEIKIDKRTICIPTFHLVDDDKYNFQNMLGQYIPIKISWKESRSNFVITDWDGDNEWHPDVAFNLDYLIKPQNKKIRYNNDDEEIPF